jgi:hypothetical protein
LLARLREAGRTFAGVGSHQDLSRQAR